MNSKNETVIRIYGNVESKHNDILVCPKCFNKWLVSERNMDISLNIEGDRPVLVDIKEDRLVKRLIVSTLSSGIFCPDCGKDRNGLITLDSEIYETVKLLNQKGYPTMFSCAGSVKINPYISFKLSLEQRNVLLNLVPGIKIYQKPVTNKINRESIVYSYKADELPESYEFMKNVYFQQFLKNVEYIDIAMYSTNEDYMHARESFYILANMLEDLSKKEEKKW